MTDKKASRVQMLERHFNPSNWKNGRSIGYTIEELSTLTDDAIEMLRRGPSLIEIEAPITVVGDLHGQYEDLMRILMIHETKKEKKVLEFTGRKFMFLGDYVDRGLYSLECIALLLNLMLHYPRHVFLIRGNHEMAKINHSYGFLDDLQRRFRKEEDGTRLWMMFNDAFAYFPVAGLIGKKVLCMHGGLSPELKSLDDLRKIRRPIHSVEENSLVADLIWSDPDPGRSIATISSTPRFLRNKTRGLSFTFNNSAVEATHGRLGTVLIVRAHQNKGCVLDIRKDGKFSLLQLSGKRKFREGEDEEEDTRADYKLSEFDEKPTSGSVEKTQKMKTPKEKRPKEKRSKEKKTSKEKSKQLRK
ncbi:hypothetical protein CRE_30394 [Caenorhabditis remanei]|uniref:Serine/threonine-protein phosphatase n=1 Tax=Caenorhabditis remanei TaxID=31234 RepID=E3NAF1_CAERE|nr:hypothetical protein CRE_30394 [Caenorhabditis remanei]